MFMKSKGLRTRLTGRLLSFLLALAVVVVPFGTSFSSTAQAAEGEGAVSAIILESAVIGNANREVTLTFNVPVFGAEPGWQSEIEVKRSNEGSFKSINYYGANASISDTGAIVIEFGEGFLEGATNQIRIKAYALVGQDTDLISDFIAVQDVNAPYLVGKAISSDLKTATLTFNTSVTTATYSVDSVNYEVDLFNYVEIDDIFMGESGMSLSEGDTISVSGNQMVFVFESPLSGHKAIHLYEGAVQGDNGILNDETSAEFNTEPIEYSEYFFFDNSQNDEEDLYGLDLDIYFNQEIVNNTPSDNALKAAITISKDGGESFTALDPNDTVTVGGGILGPFVLSDNSNGSDHLHLHFFKPLAPGSYQVRIAEGTLKSSLGFVSGEITTTEIIMSNNNAPIYQSAEVSADRKVVTLTFDKDIVDNSGNVYIWNGVGSWIQSTLFDNVKIKRSDSDFFQNLYPGDTVVLSGNKLILTLNTALTGTNNKIGIKSGILKDASGNIQRSGVITSAIDVWATSPPEYLYSTINNLNKNWTLFFDTVIKNNKESEAALKDAITLSIDGGEEKPLDSSTTVTFVDNKLVLHFSEPLVDRNIRVHIAEDAIADTVDNVLTESIETEALDPNDFYPPEFIWAELFTSHSVMLYFETSGLLDNTIDATGSRLKEAVTYSTDKGATFLPLHADDAVNLYSVEDYGNFVVVYFHNVIQGNLQIKIAGNALKDTAGNVLTTSVVTGDIDTNYAPDLIGSFYSNTPSVLTFEDNAVWRSKIQKVVLVEYGNFDYGTWAERILSPDEYKLDSGKLTIHSGLFEHQALYHIKVYSDGFETKYSESMSAIRSQDSYFITPVIMDRTSGITAKVKIGANQSNGNLHVIFQLMNGQTPVSIVAVEYDSFDDKGTFRANFNVADAATNPNYSVRAFVVSEYSNSPSSVGVNLATPITDAEYDIIYNTEDEDEID